MDLIDLDMSGKGVAAKAVVKLLSDTLTPAIKYYREERIRNFFSAIDVSYDRLDLENKEKLNEFARNPIGRAFLLERMESIISTDSKLAYWIHVLLICKDRDTWESENCEKSILRSIYQISDETLNVFQFLMECNEHHDDNAPFSIRCFDSKSDTSKLESISAVKIVAIIEDLKTRSLLVPEPTNDVGMFGGDDNGYWSFRYGITEEAIVLQRLLNKAKALMQD